MNDVIIRYNPPVSHQKIADEIVDALGLAGFEIKPIKALDVSTLNADPNVVGKKERFG